MAHSTVMTMLLNVFKALCKWDEAPSSFLSFCLSLFATELIQSVAGENIAHGQKPAMDLR